MLAGALALPASAQPTPSDMQYCADLSYLYVRYVGGSEFAPGSKSSMRTNVEGSAAMAKCREGDTAAGIPILERKLINARVALPQRR